AHKQRHLRGSSGKESNHAADHANVSIREFLSRKDFGLVGKSPSSTHCSGMSYLLQGLGRCLKFLGANYRGQVVPHFFQVLRNSGSELEDCRDERQIEVGADRVVKPPQFRTDFMLFKCARQGHSRVPPAVGRMELPDSCIGGAIGNQPLALSSWPWCRSALGDRYPGATVRSFQLPNYKITQS